MQCGLSRDLHWTQAMMSLNEQSQLNLHTSLLAAKCRRMTWMRNRKYPEFTQHACITSLSWSSHSSPSSSQVSFLFFRCISICFYYCVTSLLNKKVDVDHDDDNDGEILFFLSRNDIIWMWSVLLFLKKYTGKKVKRKRKEIAPNAMSAMHNTSSNSVKESPHKNVLWFVSFAYLRLKRIYALACIYLSISWNNTNKQQKPPSYIIIVAV